MSRHMMVPALLFFVGIAIPGAASGMAYGYFFVGILSVIAAAAFSWGALYFFARLRLPRLSGAGISLEFLAYTVAALYTVAIFRGIWAENNFVVSATISLIQAGVLSVMAFLSALMYLRRHCKERLMEGTALSLSFALMFFLGLQIVSLLIGVQHQASEDTPQAQEYAIILQAFGIDQYRMLFPLSSGTVNGAIAPVMGLILGVAFLRKTRYRLLAVLYLIPVSAVLLALNDTRSAFFAVFASIFLIFMPISKMRILPLLGCVLPVIPPLLSFFSAVLVPSIGSITNSRYDDYGMFSGREFIWGAAFAAWQKSGSILGYIFGEGMYGQVAVGASLSYSQLFSSFSEESAELASLHNSYFQVLIDVGVFGFFFYIFFVYKFIGVLALRASAGGVESVAARSFLGVFIAYLTMAGSEVVMTPYSREAAALLILVVFSACWSRSGKGQS